MHLNNGLDIPPRNRDILETSILEILRTYNASMWLAGPTAAEGNHVDSLGAIPLVGANEAVGYVQDSMSEGQAENAVYNSTFLGAGIGVNPTSWVISSPPSVVASVVGVGNLSDGMPYIDINFSGTSSAASDYVIAEPSTGLGFLPALQGEIATISLSVRLMEGVMPPRPVRFSVIERDGAGTFLTWNAATDIRSSISSIEMERLSFSHLMSSATAARATLAFRLGGVQIGDVFDFTFRVAGYQLNKGNLQGYIGTGLGQTLRANNNIAATQATTGFKPILAGGHLNYAARSQTPSDFAWAAINTTRVNSGKIYPGIGATELIKADNTVAQHSFRMSCCNTPLPPDGATVTMRVYMKYISGDSNYQLQFKNKAGAFVAALKFDMSTGFILSGALGFTYSVEKYSDGFWECTCTGPVGSGAVVPQWICYMYSGNSVEGSPADAFEMGGATIVVGNTLPKDTPPTATVPAYSSSVPYSWKFDGVDDRLAVSKPTINPAVDHFRIICYKAPAVVPAANAGLISSANNTIGNSAAARFWMQSATFSIQFLWRDDLGVSTNGFNNRSLPNERVVATGRKVGTDIVSSSRGDLASPITQTTAIAHGTITVNNERIGSHAPAAGDTNFCTFEIYGAISGNGNPTAGEILALENFLAGHAGFTPLP